MALLKHLPPTQRHELLKLRVLQLLSDPTKIEYGASGQEIIRDAARADSSPNTLQQLLKEMQAVGLIERRPDPHHKTYKPLFIASKGTDYLAGATEKRAVPGDQRPARLVIG